MSNPNTDYKLISQIDTVETSAIEFTDFTTEPQEQTDMDQKYITGGRKFMPPISGPGLGPKGGGLKPE